MIGSGIVTAVCWGGVAVGIVGALVRDLLRAHHAQHPKPQPPVARTAAELEDLFYDRPVVRR